jgi:hypothetical protein
LNLFWTQPSLCNSAAEFVVDTGQLLLIGVAPLSQDRT